MSSRMLLVGGAAFGFAGLIVVVAWRFLSTDIPLTTAPVSVSRSIAEGEDGVADALLLDPLPMSGPPDSVAVEEVVLTGRILVQEAWNREFQYMPRGSLVVRRDGEPLDVPVEAGGWTMRLSGNIEGWRIEEVWTGGRRLAFMPLDLAAVDAMVPLRAFAYEGVFVAATSREQEYLPGLLVYRDTLGPPDSKEGSRRHPGNLRRLARIGGGDAAPWTYLRALGEGENGYWLTAPGHGWALVPARATAAGAAVEVTLSPGAAIEITIDEFSPTRGLRLHIMQGGEISTTYGNLDVAAHRLEGLPPGDCEVWASFDSHPMESNLVARSESVHLVAGETAVVSLQMPSGLSSVERGRLAGSFRVEWPELWSETDAHGRLALKLVQDPPTPAYLALDAGTKHLPLERMESAAGEAGVWTWSLEGVPAGEYTLTVAPIGFELPAQVLAGETTVLDIAVPAVAVTVVELWQGGEPLKGPHVTASSPGGKVIWEAQPAEEPGGHLLVTLPGTILLDIFDVALPAIHREFTARVGWNHQRIHIEPSYSFTLRGVDGTGTMVDLPWCFDVEPIAQGGRGMLAGRSMRIRQDPVARTRRREAIFYVTHPDRFVLRFPVLEDGTWADPMTIVVEPGAPSAVHDVVVRRPGEVR